MGYVVEHTEWGLFVGTSPSTGQPVWTLCPFDGYHFSTVFAFKDTHQILEGLQDLLDIEVIANLKAHHYNGKNRYVTLPELCRMGITDQRVTSLLYCSTPEGRA